MRVKLTPAGVKDYLPAECAGIFSLDNKLAGLYTVWGYERVETPLIEFLDVYSESLTDMNNACKFTDHNGRLLALRPDITTSVARMAAAKADLSAPCRYYYLGDTLSFVRGHGRSQHRQAGVELMGDASLEADTEVIALAIESLLSAGVTDFQVEIGEVNFFRGLMQEAGLTESQQEELRLLVEQKNNLDIELFLRPFAMEGKLRRLIAELPYLYGDASVLAKAQALSAHPLCQAAVTACKQVAKALCEYGYGQYISFDLGMVQSLSYYTGIIFQGMVNNMAAPVLRGGRYNNLLRQFGQDAPAVGFALLEYELLEILPVKKEGKPKILVSCAPDSREKAYRYAKTLRASGKPVLFIPAEKTNLTALLAKYAPAEAWYFEKGEGARL